MLMFITMAMAGSLNSRYCEIFIWNNNKKKQLKTNVDNRNKCEIIPQLIWYFVDCLATHHFQNKWIHSFLESFMNINDKLSQIPNIYTECNQQCYINGFG